MKNKIILFILSSAVFFIPLSNGIVYAKANTLAELRGELSSLKKQQQQNKEKQNLTKSQINSAKNNIESNQNQIQTNQQKVITATNESAQLEQEISSGKEKLEKLVKTYQISKNENVYLKYVFDATSYEDLVYRYAIIEQVMNYQEEQIGEWKDKIAYNAQLKKDLEAKEKELQQQIGSLNQSIDKLGSQLSELNDMTQDIEAEIKSIQSSIDFYVSIGCKENDNLDVCLSVSGDKIFRKPLTKGTITSSFGYRIHPITKKKKFHSGTDIGVAEGTKVYSIANGTVSKLVKKSKCGGNMVYVQHIVNGKKYTSTYMHLWKINAKLGQKVDSNTVVGLSGGGKHTASKYGGYDTCTTGAHLHLSLATGWYEKDYFSYSSWLSHLINPKDTLKLPKSWSSR